MTIIEFDARLPATQQYGYGGLITVYDDNQLTIRFVIERSLAWGANSSWVVDSDEIVPRDLLPVLLQNCVETSRTTA
jgi:hypothetical protein